MRVYKRTPQGSTFKDATGEVIINKHSLDWRHDGGVGFVPAREEHAAGGAKPPQGWFEVQAVVFKECSAASGRTRYMACSRV